MFGFITALTFLVLVLLLPLFTSMRLLRTTRELDELKQRVLSLEAQIAALLGRRPPVTLTQAPAVEPTGKARAESTVDASQPIPSAAAPIPPSEIAPAAPPAAPPLPVEATPPSPSLAAEGIGATDAERPAAATADDDLDLEGRIGGRWLLYTGVVVLLLGVAFFLKYAFDNAWIDETARVLIGGVAGIALIMGGWRLAESGLAVFGQALIGTGLAVLYLAIYAALSFYALIDNVIAFALMVVDTISAAFLADRRRSQALAVIAVGGGFLTPFLVGGGEDAQLTLFTYDALLVAGTLVLAERHEWFGLNALSYVFTYLTILSWWARYYTEAKWVRTFLFLTLFCMLFVLILRATRRSSRPIARLVVALLSTAPVFYHIAAIVLTARHAPAIHVYIIAFTAVGLWLTAEPHRATWRLIVLFGGYIPLFGTLTLPTGISWLTANLVTIVAVAALHVMALLDRAIRQGEKLERADLLSLQVTGLGLFGLLYQTLQTTYPEFRGGLAALLAIGATLLWRVFRNRDALAALNAAALAFALTAIGIAVQFDGPAVVIGWAAEGAAIAWLGIRASNRPFQAGGLFLWALAVSRLLDGYFDTPAAFVAVLNERSLSTLFVIALAYVLGWTYDRLGGPEAGRIRAALHVAASVLTLLWMSAEIRSYWEIRYETPQADLYRQVGLSLAWGVYGAFLIASGMQRRYPPDRYIGITVIVGTILKVFFVDLWELGGIYRVVGFIAFGVLLVLVSYLYQRKKRDRLAGPADQPAH